MVAIYPSGHGFFKGVQTQLLHISIKDKIATKKGKSEETKNSPLNQIRSRKLLI